MISKNLSPNVMQYIVSPTQLEIDQKMVPYDILGTMAHVIMLKKTYILSLSKAAKILQALQVLSKEHEDGFFEIDPQKGAQLTLESKIVGIAGEEAGLSAHTARSRNDQVMVTEMMYSREEILKIQAKILNVISSLLDLSKEHVETVFPGYTHMQPAKPTTFAHWCLAYCESLLRIGKQLTNSYELYNLCPLGAVESFGTSWPIDRKMTTDLLGFGDVWEVTLDAISSRGFPQLAILDGLNQFGIVASKLAADLLLFSTFEYGLVSFGDNVSQRLHPVTGSSVMAQKKNPDVLELVRSVSPQITGFHQIVSGILAGLPSGYNRDEREVKEYMVLSMNKVNTTLDVLLDVLISISIHKERALTLVKTNYSLTTDFADYVSQKSGLPYRLVYKIVGEVVDAAIQKGKSLSAITSLEIQEAASKYNVSLEITNDEFSSILDPVVALGKRKHPGGTNASVTKQMIQSLEYKVNKEKSWVFGREEKILRAKAKIQKMMQEIISEANI
ncbi:argininosuccinate lyase [Candidatus Gottesmanbacteria bacterium]|nr:argininosuccinate lyase [Candidatus Gottesmanbacteria bacterium]